jgi:hypothetical protein
MKRKPPPSSPDVEAAAAAYLAKRRGRAAIKPAPAAGQAAARVLRPLARRFGPGVDQFTEHWPEIVGEKLAAWCAPETIQRRRDGDVLIIRARGPAGAVIQAEAPRLLEKVKLYCGDRAPTQLKVVQGAAGQPARKNPFASAAAKTTSRAASLPNRQAASQLSEGVEPDAQARLDSLLKAWDRRTKDRR